MSSAILAVGWEPELRGLLTVIIGVVVLCGSVYLILGTNLGARLGFIVALAGLAGWMALMGAVWWIYGIGLIGPAPEWVEVEGRTVIQEAELLDQAGVLVVVPDEIAEAESANAQVEAVRDELEAEGWERVPESDATFGQASAAAGVFLEEEGAFEAGEFQVTALYKTGGERYPKIGESIDFIAFFHEDSFALAEVSTFVPLRDEPGRAPTQPVVDEEVARQYVYMVRDPGAVRQPAAVITIGSTLVFLALCWMLHRRDRIVAENRSQAVATA